MSYKISKHQAPSSRETSDSKLQGLGRRRRGAKLVLGSPLVVGAWCLVLLLSAAPCVRAADPTPALTGWVKMGLPAPRLATAAQKARPDETKAGWAWQKLAKPPVPEVKDASWPKTPIENFILAKLEKKDLKPNPPADKRTLIRRATFDLTGLPPAPEEVDDFIADNTAEAFA